jgi:hypothetical protein
VAVDGRSGAYRGHPAALGLLTPRLRPRGVYAYLALGIYLVTAPHRAGMAPYPGQARCLALGFLARVLPEARCQGWPKVMSGGNAERP